MDFTNNTRDTFIAFSIMVFIQLTLLIISTLSGKNLSSSSIFENILRPFATTLIDKLNREGRSDFALIFRGSIVFAILSIIAVGIIIAIEFISPLIGLNGWSDIILLCLLLSPLSIIMPALGISQDNVREGQYKIMAQAVNQNLITSDKHGLRRVSFRGLSTSLIEWVVAPISLFLIGGIFIAYVYAVISIMVRLTNAQHSAFLSVYLLLYRGVHLVLSIIGCLFVGLAACFSVGGKPLSIFKSFKRPPLFVESAFAYTQNIVLGGAGQDRLGNTINAPWIGPEGATAKLEHADVICGVYQYCVSVFLIGVSLFALWAFL